MGHRRGALLIAAMVGTTVLRVVSPVYAAAPTPHLPVATAAGEQSTSERAHRDTKPNVGSAFVPVTSSRMTHVVVRRSRGRTIRVTGLGVIPRHVAAVALNVVASHVSASARLTASTPGRSPPGVTSLSVVRHRSSSGLVLARPSATGKVALALSRGNARLAVTAVGYDAVAGPKGAGSSIVALPHPHAVSAAVVASRPTRVHLLGTHGLPAKGVTAAIAVLTVHNPSATTSLVARPAGRSAIGAPVIAIQAGRIASTTIIVPPGHDGAITLSLAKGNAKVSLQVIGYDAAFGSAQAGAIDVALGGVRVLDPQLATGHDEPMRSGATTSVAVLGRRGVPGTGVKAVWLDVTTSDPSRPTALSISGGAPAVTVAAPAHVATTSLVLVRTAAGHRIRLSLGRGHTPVTVDMVGYLAADPVPTAVTHVAPSGVTSTAAHLSWQPTGQQNLVRTVVRRQAGSLSPSGPNSGQLVASLAPNASKAGDRKLSPGTRYSYSIFTVDDVGRISKPAMTQLSTAVPKVLPAISNGSVTAARTSSISLRWDNPTSKKLTGVMVRRMSGPLTSDEPGAGALLANLGPSAHRFTDSSGGPGTAYTYLLFAEYGDKTARSNVVSAATTGPTDGPSPITQLRAGVEDLNVQLSWTNSTSYQYLVIRRADGTTPPATPGSGDDVTAGADTTRTSATDGGLTAGRTYSYSLFAEDNAGHYSEPATTSVTVSSAGRANVCGTVTGDQVWSPAQADVYVITCAVTIADGARVEVEPGTIIKDDDIGSFTIDGSFVVNGEAANPVYFTSYHDDSIGGDTNNDGGATAPAPGDWGYIAGGYATGLISFNHAVVEYGGAGNAPALIATSATVTNSRFAHLHGNAIELNNDAPAPVVTNNTIDDVAGTGIYVSSGAVSAPTVSNNTVTAADGPAIVVGSNDLRPSLLTGNTGSQDYPTAIEIGGTLTENLTLPLAGLPLVVSGEYVQYGQQTDTLVVPPHVTLTLNAGAVLKFGVAAYFTPPGSLLIQGTLIGNGTAANPVVLTSVLDDSAGGDTNGDGSNLEPSAGNWNRLDVAPASGGPAPVVDLEHTTVAYSAGIVATDTANVTLSHDLVKASMPDDAALSFTPSYLGSVDVEDSTVDGSTTDGIDVITQVLPTDAIDYDVTVANNAVNNVVGHAISITSRDLRPDRLLGNTGSDDGVTAIEIAGTLESDLTLPTPGLQWAFFAGNECGRGYGYGPLAPGCNTGLTVSPSATLTLNPGAVLKADATDNGSPSSYPNGIPTLNVEGTLIGAGTAAAPAVITSIRDNSAGALAVSGIQAVPGAGDWGGVATLSLETPPTVDLDYTTVAYAGIGSYDNSDITLTNDLVEHTGGTDYYGPGAIDLTSLRGGSVDVDHTTVSDAAGGIYVNDDGKGTPATVKENVVTGASGSAYNFVAPDLTPNQLTGNTGSGNELNIVQFNGRLAADLALPMAGLPWVLGESDESCGTGCPDVALEVSPGVTMTLAAGEIFKAIGDPVNDGQGAELPAVDVEGTLTTDGTAANPVVMTAFTDDAVGGDLNNDGATTSPIAGDWGGVIGQAEAGEPAPAITLRHTTVRYATQIYAGATTSLTMTDGVVSDMSEDGIDANLSSAGRLDVERTAITDIAGIGIEYASVSTSAGDGPTLTNDQITDIANAAVLLDANDIVPDQITGNTGGADHPSAIVASGQLAGDLILPVAGLPWEVTSANSPGLTVPPGITVTLDTGAVLKFARVVSYLYGYSSVPPSLTVQGSLVGSGTAGSPAVLTSGADDAAGGDTNGDGNGSVGVPGDWAGVVMSPVTGQAAPSISLAHTTVEYATTALTVASGNASVTGTITNDTAGIVGPVKDASQNCTNGVVTATPVDWGTTTGPAPHGTGPSVSGCVDVEPWVGE